MNKHVYRSRPLGSNNSKGIEVRGAWVLGYSYPVAGDPSIGFLALSIGALYVFIFSLATGYYTKDGGRLAGCNTLVATVCAPLSSLVIFLKSFGERAGAGLLLHAIFRWSSRSNARKVVQTTDSVT